MVELGTLVVVLGIKVEVLELMGIAVVAVIANVVSVDAMVVDCVLLSG